MRIIDSKLKAENLYLDADGLELQSKELYQIVTNYLDIINTKNEVFERLLRRIDLSEREQYRNKLYSKGM
jgi:hypothetical protein